MQVLAAAEQLQQQQVLQLALRQRWLQQAWAAAHLHTPSRARRLVAGHC
jgi:hypothetical protein